MSDSTHAKGDHGSGDSAKGGGGHGKKHGGDHGSVGHEEHHEGAPEWLISFADNVTLMMGFFVILFALNADPKDRQTGGSAPDETGAALDNDHMLDLIIAVREAFHNPVRMNSKDVDDQELIRRIRDRSGKGRSKTPGIEGRDQEANATKPSDFHSQAGMIRFADNSAALSPDARHTVAELSKKVRGTNLIIEVRGNAGAAEALGSTDRAMRLAMERAIAVAQALADQGIDWRQLRLVGAADTDRLARYPGSRDEDRANARVEVVITDEVVPEEVPTDASTAQQSAAWTE